MEKKSLIELLKKSTLFSDEEKSELIAKFDNLPAEAVSEIEKMLSQEAKEIQEIEDAFAKEVKEAIEPIKLKTMQESDYDKKEITGFYDDMAQKYINSVQKEK